MTRPTSGGMLIRMTQRLCVSSGSIATYAASPYDMVATSLIEKAEKQAARRWVKECPELGIVKTLPPHILSLLPTGCCLVVKGNAVSTVIEIPPTPILRGIIASNRYDTNSGVGTPTYDSVIAGHEEAQQTVDEALEIRRKGADFKKSVQEWLDTTGFTTAEQLCWSCRPLVHLINNVEAASTEGKRSHYYRSRRYDGMEILLDTIRKRRYLTQDKMRRPRQVATFPDHLTTLCGECQIILSSHKNAKR